MCVLGWYRQYWGGFLPLGAVVGRRAQNPMKALWGSTPLCLHSSSSSHPFYNSGPCRLLDNANRTRSTVHLEPARPRGLFPVAPHPRVCGACMDRDSGGQDMEDVADVVDASKDADMEDDDGAEESKGTGDVEEVEEVSLTNVDSEQHSGKPITFKPLHARGNAKRGKGEGGPVSRWQSCMVRDPTHPPTLTHPRTHPRAHPCTHVPSPPTLPPTLTSWAHPSSPTHPRTHPRAHPMYTRTFSTHPRASITHVPRPPHLPTHPPTHVP